LPFTSEAGGAEGRRSGRRTAFRLGAAFFALCAAAAPVLRGQSTLLYLELQAVGAYATSPGRFELFSLMPADAMQKPGAGLDLVRRLRGRTGDVGALAVQARLVYNEDTHRLQPQLYNAYLRLKPRFANVWIGHNRPAMGLASVLDNHALLLPDPAMLGYGFDRDWGVGLDRDFAWGGLAASLTAGSGMPLYFKGNYLAAARIFKGVLARDGCSVGLSLSGGRVLETMGYMLADPEPAGWLAAGLDLSQAWRNLESRAEILIGRRGGAATFLAFWRPGLSLLEEGRLKIELQPALVRRAGAWDHSLGAGLTYLFDADLAGRVMVYRDSLGPGLRVVAQFYYYKRL